MRRRERVERQHTDLCRHTFIQLSLKEIVCVFDMQRALLVTGEFVVFVINTELKQLRLIHSL